MYVIGIRADGEEIEAKSNLHDYMEAYEVEYKYTYKRLSAGGGGYYPQEAPGQGTTVLCVTYNTAVSKGSISVGNTKQVPNRYLDCRKGLSLKVDQVIT